MTKTPTPAGVIWSLDRIDDANETLDGSYDLTGHNAGGDNVTVYVVDSGVRVSHSEFEGRASAPTSANIIADGKSDCNGHGTHCAGTVAGKTYGVAKNAKIVSVKVFGCTGGSSTSTVLAGFNWVLKNHNTSGPALISASLGGPVSRAKTDAIEVIIRRGISVVVAAGNNRANACTKSPAALGGLNGETITVASIDQGDSRSSFSNYGSQCTDLFAPGRDILSAGIRDDFAAKRLSGTSMATPAVAGAAALFLQHHPNASPFHVKRYLLCTAVQGKVSDARGTPNRLLQVHAVLDAACVNHTLAATTYSPALRRTRAPMPCVDSGSYCKYGGKSRCETSRYFKEDCPVTCNSCPSLPPTSHPTFAPTNLSQFNSLTPTVPPTSLRPTAAPTQVPPYEIVRFGECEAPILTREDCNNAAKLLGRGELNATEDRGWDSYDPAGCYMAYGRLWINVPHTNSGSCSSYNECLCMRRTSSPTFSPTSSAQFNSQAPTVRPTSGAPTAAPTIHCRERSYCPRYSKRMCNDPRFKESCPATCGACPPATFSPTSLSQYNSLTPTVVPSAPTALPTYAPCKDEPICAGYPSTHCQRYRAFRQRCPVRCNSCLVPTSTPTFSPSNAAQFSSLTPTVAPTRVQRFENRSVGRCAVYIQSVEECSAAAKELRFRDFDVTDDDERSTSPYWRSRAPPGCYSYYGRLLFNNHTNTAACSSSARCVCIRRASAPTSRPTLTPTLLTIVPTPVSSTPASSTPAVSTTSTPTFSPTSAAQFNSLMPTVSPTGPRKAAPPTTGPPTKLLEEQVSFSVQHMTQAEFNEKKEGLRRRLAEVANVTRSRVQVTLQNRGAEASSGQRHLLLMPMNALEESAGTESGAGSVIVVSITDAIASAELPTEPTSRQGVEAITGKSSEEWSQLLGLKVERIKKVQVVSKLVGTAVPTSSGDSSSGSIAILLVGLGVFVLLGMAGLIFVNHRSPTHQSAGHHAPLVPSSVAGPLAVA